jgi:hypothetical protein
MNALSTGFWGTEGTTRRSSGGAQGSGVGGDDEADAGEGMVAQLWTSTLRSYRIVEITYLFSVHKQMHNKKYRHIYKLHL